MDQLDNSLITLALGNLQKLAVKSFPFCPPANVMSD